MGNLATPKSVQKLQTALHAKAKAEAGYRFYALYDKISRDDILAHAYAQCRSNKGAPGIDGQDFADIEAYGVERWLAELALALRQETYRPEPIRRVYIPKANGNLRPLGISSVRDRVCMTAATLVLEPIFEADLPPEQLRLPAGAERPAGGGRGGGAAVSRTPGSRRCRPRGFLWEHSPYRTNEIGGTPDRRPARAASDQDVAGVRRGGNRRARTEATHDRGPRQRPWHPAGLTALTAAGESLHAPVCAGMGEARTRAKPRQSHRDLCGRSRDPVQKGQREEGTALHCARSWAS